MEYDLKRKLVTRSVSLDYKKKPKSYTKDDIKSLTSTGYILVAKELWDYIPTKSHVRYAKNGEDSIESRFKPGGFVRNHFLTSNNKKGLVLENKIGGKQGDKDYISFPIVFDDIDKIWKKYPKDAFIEIHLINNSLAAKKAQINTLSMQIMSIQQDLDDKKSRIEQLEQQIKEVTLKLSTIKR